MDSIVKNRLTFVACLLSAMTMVSHVGSGVLSRNPHVSEFRCAVESPQRLKCAMKFSTSFILDSMEVIILRGLIYKQIACRCISELDASGKSNAVCSANLPFTTTTTITGEAIAVFRNKDLPGPVKHEMEFSAPIKNSGPTTQSTRAPQAATSTIELSSPTGGPDVTTTGSFPSRKWILRWIIAPVISGCFIVGGIFMAYCCKRWPTACCCKRSPAIKSIRPRNEGQPASIGENCDCYHLLGGAQAESRTVPYGLVNARNESDHEKVNNVTVSRHSRSSILNDGVTSGDKLMVQATSRDDSSAELVVATYGLARPVNKCISRNSNIPQTWGVSKSECRHSASQAESAGCGTTATGIMLGVGETKSDDGRSAAEIGARPNYGAALSEPPRIDDSNSGNHCLDKPQPQCIAGECETGGTASTQKDCGIVNQWPQQSAMSTVYDGDDDDVLDLNLMLSDDQGPNNDGTSSKPPLADDADDHKLCIATGPSVETAEIDPHCRELDKACISVADDDMPGFVDRQGKRQSANKMDQRVGNADAGPNQSLKDDAITNNKLSAAVGATSFTPLSQVEADVGDALTKKASRVEACDRKTGPPSSVLGQPNADGVCDRLASVDGAWSDNG